MDFTFTPEQDALREQAREFLAATPEPTWAQLTELGWTGVSIAGGGRRGRAHVRRGGRALRGARARPVPRALPVTFALALPALPDDLRAEVASGEATWTLALGPLLTDLDTADRVAIVGGDGIYELEGAEREVLTTTDATRPLGVVRGGDPGRRLADSTILPEIDARARAALAIEACGVGRRALELAIEYAASREQFGRRIGVYQAVSHPLADAYTQVELARSLALWAAWCVATGDAQASVAAAAAKAYAADAAVGVCETAIQTLGGIGFTWEHVLHRLYKRALGIQSLAGSGTRLRAEVAAELLNGREESEPGVPVEAAPVGQGG